MSNWGDWNPPPPPWFVGRQGLPRAMAVQGMLREIKVFPLSASLSSPEDSEKEVSELGTGTGNWEMGAKKKKGRELELGIGAGNSELEIRVGIGDL